MKFYHISLFHDYNDNPEECVDPVNVLILIILSLKEKLKHRKRKNIFQHYRQSYHNFNLKEIKKMWHRQKGSKQGFIN